jgi:CPA2 family monovalent cation:H+ antiporter-2
MDHGTALVETLAIGLTAAFVGGLVARRIGLPPIVGYLVAGVLIGPFTPGLVADTGVAAELAELGVILLMFGVGLHFSIPDLLAVRRIAVPGAMGQIAVATLLGIGLGMALGWGFAGGLVLGLSLSVASTVVLLRALEDRNELDTQQGRIAVGWLIVEDLFTVAVLVLLPSIAPILLGQSDGDYTGPVIELVVALGKAAIFAVLMIIVGRRVVPVILASVARERSRELFTLAVLAIAIGIAFSAAVLFGVSFALGAFLAGVVLSESDLSHQAAADALPLRDAFAVLFFVSVGMLVDPSFLVGEPLAILAVTLLVVVGKSIAAFVIVAAFGYPVRTGLTVSAALAQIGEFSFILATLGLSLALLPPEAFQLIVAGSLVSIMLNPFIFRLTGPLEAWIRGRPRLLTALERRSPELRTLPGDDADQLRGHAVLCGYGTVGGMIGAVLEGRGFRYAVISDDRREVEQLRRQGTPAVYGNASNPAALHAVRAGSARVIIAAISDPATARLIVDAVRELAPRVPLVVRTHSTVEARTLRSMGPTIQAVHAQQEVAIQMTRYSLRRFGVSGAEVDAIAEGMRRRGADTDPRGGAGGSGMRSLRRRPGNQVTETGATGRPAEPQTAQAPLARPAPPEASSH